MSYEEIERVTSPLKKASVQQEKETKLPTKSAATEENNAEDVPYYLRIHNYIAGVNS